MKKLFMFMLLLLTGCVQKTLVKNCFRTVDKEGHIQEYYVCEGVWLK